MFSIEPFHAIAQETLRIALPKSLPWQLAQFRHACADLMKTPSVFFENFTYELGADATPNVLHRS